jgi:hypothetical protein
MTYDAYRMSVIAAGKYILLETHRIFYVNLLHLLPGDTFQQLQPMGLTMILHQVQTDGTR